MRTRLTNERFDIKGHRKWLKSLTPLQRQAYSNWLHGPENSWASQFKTEPRDSWQHVYLVRSGNYIKIGIAIRVEDRLNGIQTGNPEKIELLFAQKHPYAGELEKGLHALFAEKRYRGEWFSLDENDFVKAKERICQQ